MKGMSVSRGNMYDWVTHMWSPLVGCPHQCSYCYVRNRFRDLPATVTEKEYWPHLGSGRVIFVGHLCDIFADPIPVETVERILGWCAQFSNEYVFQTKNPQRVAWPILPRHSIVGTTIETNRQYLLDRISKAPPVSLRSAGLAVIKGRKFLTIEPVMAFDLEPLAQLVIQARPDFVNIGADSKRHGLPEPTRPEVLALAAMLQEAGIEIRKKENLERLTG